MNLKCICHLGATSLRNVPVFGLVTIILFALGVEACSDGALDAQKQSRSMRTPIEAKVEKSATKDMSHQSDEEDLKDRSSKTEPKDLTKEEAMAANPERPSRISGRDSGRRAT